MSQRKKEEERIEKIIRGLLKLPENKRCINCNSLGPQYVCTTFWTFICTYCSGIHREFTHRVKSVSMAKFNAEEVSALQAGGNERAREIYFKAWDPQRHSYPDAGNLHKLRDFIKQVYVDRRYTGERSSDRLPTLKTVVKDKLYDRRSYERSSQGLRDEFYDRNSFGRSSLSSRIDDKNIRHHTDDRRSPSYGTENGRSGARRSRSTARFEIVDDRFRDDEYGSGRRSQGRGFSNTISRAASMSPEAQRIREKANPSPPVLRPLKDIMGDPPPPKPNRQATDGSTYAQKTASTGNLESLDVKAIETKSASTSSLIDLDNNFEVLDTPAKAQTQTATSVQSSVEEKASSNFPKVNSVEALLFELSIGPVGSNVSEVPTSNEVSSATPVASSNSVATEESSSITNTPAVPNTITSSNGQAIPCSRADSEYQVNDRQQAQAMQQPQPSSELPAAHGSSTAQKGNSTLEAALSDQRPWFSSPAPNAQEQPSIASVEQSSQAVSMTPQNTNSGDGSISTGRKELPIDLFAFNYPSFHAPVQNWQFGPTHGMGYGMQYPPPAAGPMPVPNSSKSRNPFDLGDDSAQSQATMFPSMATLQGAFPQMAHQAGVQPQPSPYAAAVPQQSPPYGMAMPPGAYMGQQQQLPNNMPNPRPQGNDGSDRGDAAFASLNPIRRSTSETSTQTASNSFSSASGNPFW